MLLLLTACAATQVAPPTPPPVPVAPAVPTVERSTQWVHNSAEFDAVLATIYLAAGQALVAPEAGPWAVVSDVDETLIDNSLYQVETLGQFSPETWAIWEEQGRAVALPGAVALVARVHEMGGRMAFVTNRSKHQETLELLQAQGLWAEGDRLCVRTETSDKSARRQSVLEGGALCGWEGEPTQVVAYWGDQRGDFPAQSDAEPWGTQWFMLPNPMYGSWAE